MRRVVDHRGRDAEPVADSIGVRRLVAAAELRPLRLGDLAPGADTDTYLQRRAELGLAVSSDAPFLVDKTGVPVSPDGATAYLRRLRTIAVSIEGNAGTCRALLATRYHAGQGVGHR